MFKREARAKKATDFKNDAERKYEDENDVNIRPKINDNVAGLPQLDSPQEGICESKGQIRDARNPQENHQEESNPNGEQEGAGEEENQPPNGDGQVTYL